MQKLRARSWLSCQNWWTQVRCIQIETFKTHPASISVTWQSDWTLLTLTILWFHLHCYLVKPQHACKTSSEHPLLQSISACQAIHRSTVPCHCCLPTALVKCATQCDTQFQWQSSAPDCAAGTWLSSALCEYLPQGLVSVDLFAYPSSETTYKVQLSSTGNQLTCRAKLYRLIGNLQSEVN